MQITINLPEGETEGAAALEYLDKALRNITIMHPEWTSCVITITRVEWNHAEAMRRQP